MKQYWQRIAGRIDALTLRERAIVFALAALVLITAINIFLLDPLFAQTKRLSDQIKREQSQIAETQHKIQAAVRLQTEDPDAESKARLHKLTEQSKQMQASLQELQKGLVSPDKMSNLLEGILRRHGNLRLVSLKTLPPASLADSGETHNKNTTDRTVGPARPDAVPRELKDKTSDGRPPLGYIYRHGVEITVQGGYLDMVSYVTELEAMPLQVFWGKGVLNAEEYSKTTLTLTLYTLSLDRRWLNI